VSGNHSDREQFKTMFKAASRREFDLLVTSRVIIAYDPRVPQ
jgi:hypothetical protein